MVSDESGYHHRAWTSHNQPIPLHPERINRHQLKHELDQRTGAKHTDNHLYLGGPSQADSQAYVVPDVSQFDATTPVVSAALHLHAYGSPADDVELDQILDTSQITSQPVEDEDVATAIDSQSANGAGDLKFDITDLMSLWVAGDAPDGLILKAPASTTTALEIG